LYDLNETVHLGSCIVKDKEWTVILSFIKKNICTNTTTYKLHIEWRQVEPKLNGTTLLFYFIYIFLLGNIALTIFSPFDVHYCFL